MTYQTIAGNVTLGLQVYIIQVLQHLLQRQNLKLRGLCSERGGFRRSIEKDLEECLKTQFSLTDLLTSMNAMFTPHIAIRITLVVPRIISTIWLTQGDLSDVLFVVRAILNVVKTMTDVVALVVIPAGINASIEQTHQIVCRNWQLWIPPTENLHRLSRAMIEHLKQPAMGISLGGFAVITRALLVTLVSLTVTVLTIFRELGRTPFANTTNIGR